MQNFIKILHAVQELYAFSLTVEGRTDGWTDTKMMLGQASSPFRIPLTGQCLNK